MFLAPLFFKQMKNGPYILVVPPKLYPGKKYRNRYAYEHHVVWWLHNHEIIKPGFVIHHKNHNKHDNRIENLELILSTTHSKHHTEKPWTYVFATCFFCDNIFRIRGNHYRTRLKQSGNKIYCGRSCQVKMQRKEIKFNAGYFSGRKGGTVNSDQVGSIPTPAAKTQGSLNVDFKPPHSQR
jgi:hypothetical protein